MALHAFIDDLVNKAAARVPAPRDGRDGEPGRDALDLDVVDLDPKRSYQRGTWACYRGGTFRAVRQTEPFEEPIGDETLARSGWRCMFDGIYDEVEEYLDEGRHIEKVTVWSSGRTKKVTRIGRSSIYRGVFKLGSEYRKGDEVTWGGSTWHCLAESSKEQPGAGSPEWVLAVKQGERGKSARIESSDAPRSVVRIK